MNDKNINVTFFEKLSLLGYGYKLCAKLTPLYLPFVLLRAVFTAAQPLIVLFFSARILNQLYEARDVRTIIVYVGITIGATFILSILRSLLTREIDTMAQWELTYQRLMMMQAERFAKMDYAHTEDSNISEVLARMDTQARGNGLGVLNIYLHTDSISERFFSLVFSWALLMGPLSVQVHGEIRWPVYALFAFFAMGMLFMLHMQSRTQQILARNYEENAKINTVARYYNKYVKAGEAAKDIRLYSQSETLSEIFKNSFNIKRWTSFFFYGARVEGIMFALLAVASGGYYIIAGYNALMGTATLGGVVQSVGAVTIFASSAGGLVFILGLVFNNAAFIKPMREYLLLPDLLVKGEKPVPKKQEGANAVPYEFEFKNVSFSYPGAEENTLHNINLVFNVGERLAVVGQNGSGKTTMIKLLCRLYDPTEGEILLNGVNIKEYDYTEYISLFSVVFQDFFLFPLKLGENVAAQQEYNKDRVFDCLDGAGFSERLNTMADGLDTMLYKTYDEDGTQVSGGEAQKIALARALYRDAPFVILDEPTAALDPIAEYDIYTTFDETIGDKTAVFISHRLSSCRFCHDIAVFEAGRVVQKGGHDELLADENGLYRQLWDAQAQHYVG
ncbi:MAG: ABC transporter ATP-binding protein/permease [Oscillospiraceae bacterium]|nr:ABC transporter ATP-binding protein/permease [Oscillospiraceae bacterium]